MKALTSETLYGNWATLLLATDDDGGMDYSRLSDEIDVLIDSAPDGIYSNGTAGEFYSQSHDEFLKISEMLAEKCEKRIAGLQVKVLPVVNDFFGATVTCTGLLTGIDTVNAILSYQEEHGKIDEVMIAGNMLMEFKEVFLCGMTPMELSRRLGVPVRVCPNDGVGFLTAMLGVNDDTPLYDASREE